MPINLPETNQPRVVIAGAGFAGVMLARRLSTKDYQVVIIDRNNFHQFQPLLYQVAMSAIEPSSIAFPLRRLFREKKNFHIRVAEIQSIQPEEKYLMTNAGRVNYDILVLANGVTTNYFGNSELAQKTYSLKSVADALLFRNALLSDLEKALTIREHDVRQGYLDLVIVGGGPTGVELAGSLAEFRKFILAKEYPELDPKEMGIHLVEGDKRLLNSFSPEASAKSRKFLEKLGVDVISEARVLNYDGNEVTLSDGRKLYARKVIWTAGITGIRLEGIPETCYTKNNRLKTDVYSRVEGIEGVFAIGDGAYMEESTYKGHPQVAQPAIQQARHLSKNLMALAKGQIMKPFHYKDLGSLATIGRNKAVADLPYLKTQCFIAWLLWIFVHLKSLLGVKNKIQVFFNWVWSYITMDQNLRIMIRHKVKNET